MMKRKTLILWLTLGAMLFAGISGCAARNQSSDAAPQTASETPQSSGNASRPTSPAGVPAAGTGAVSGNTAAGGDVSAPAASGKVAYLTFDDGPSPLTPALLQTLQQCGVHATFFVVGSNSEKYPDCLRQIVQAGNVLGVHSWTHDYSYIYKNMENFTQDFHKLRDYLQQETGVTPNLCRFPGGTNNTVCFHYNKDHIMKKIVAQVKAEGFTYYDWNVSSAEASAKPPTKEQVVSNVVSGCTGKKIAVVLCHDTDHMDYVNAIPEIVAKLRAMGFTFDTLAPGNPPVSGASTVQFKPR